MTEELALEQRLRDGGAIDAHVIGGFAAAQGVDGAGDQFLARAALAQDENRGIGRCNGLNEAPQIGHRGMIANNMGKGKLLGAGFFEG